MAVHHKALGIPPYSHLYNIVIPPIAMFLEAGSNLGTLKELH